MTKKIMLLLAGIILSLVLPQSALGIGQITQPIIFKDVLKGQVLESVLVLYNSGENEEVYKLIAGGKIEKWTSFYSLDDSKNPISEIIVPAKSNLKAGVKFIVPVDAPNGEYAGEVSIIAAPKKNENEKGTNVSVGMQVSRPVSITVTGEEIIKFDAFVTPRSYIIEKDKPLEINAVYYNMGNVAIKPDLQVRISKNEQGLFNVIFPYPENEEEIKPLASKTIPVEWQTTGQGEGMYKAETKVFLNGAVIQNDEFTFSVGPIQSDNIGNNSGLLASISSIGGGRIISILSLIGGVLIILTIFVGKKRVLKKKGLRRRILLR